MHFRVHGICFGHFAAEQEKIVIVACNDLAVPFVGGSAYLPSSKSWVDLVFAALGTSLREQPHIYETGICTGKNVNAFAHHRWTGRCAILSGGKFTATWTIC